MSNPIKQLSNLLVTFIDKNFMPILDTRVIEVAKAVSKWNCLKNFILTNEMSEPWKLERFIGELSANESSIDALKLQIESNSKASTNVMPLPLIEITTSNGINLTTSRPFQKANDLLSQVVEKERRESFGGGKQLSEVRENNERQRNELKINIQSFQSLMTSFQRLCANFQNNQKKLSIT